MNLSIHPRLSELGALTQQLKKEHYYYDIIVEHDGAVRVEASLRKIPDNQFRFCFRQCLLKSKSEDQAALKNLKHLNQLYKNLLYCWENNMTGVIEADYITGILNLQRRHEVNESWENENLKTMFITNGREKRHTHAF